MPLDGSTLALSAADALDVALRASGLTPIDPGFLDEHKARQVRQHPPSWIYHHRAAIQLMLVVALVASLASFAGLSAADHYGLAATLGLALFAVAVAPMLLPVRGPAQWQERPLDGELPAVHPLVREAALRLKARLPEVDFRVGELFQGRVTLDPYLLADYRGAQVVLGIWDGERLIASA